MVIEYVKLIGRVLGTNNLQEITLLLILAGLVYLILKGGK